VDYVYFDPDHALLRLPRKQLRFPLPLKTPPGFRAAEPQSWPQVEGRLEYVDGELLWMPPCADYQQDVASEAVRLLGNWSVKHPEFIVAGNEAGMLLGGEARGADAAVWRKADVGVHRGTFRKVAPVLAVEVAGEDETEVVLREKARWYLGHGVEQVWLLFPKTRLVLVLGAKGMVKVKGRSLLPQVVSLPGLKVTAQSFFRQLTPAS
jgi:Uma2 family endonuclease